ncbi:hypothetical protein B0T22DRAFT_202825 [Podospora appendiculata]|uniref:Uncharacterized protein n=1 Tax=Podospora appendiculata TaxID=314037 RepID=A0AAE0X4C7_9PEZI|nr:hypothetical protein B0T22DRAFT_202825 [Podospora appendiculata]
MSSTTMMASAALQPVLLDLSPPQVEYTLTSHGDGLSAQPRMFKKHKILPHPRKDDRGPEVYDLQRSAPRRRELERVSRSAGLPAQTPPLRQRTRRQGGGPEPPPTPPAHSRTSSSSKSVTSVSRLSPKHAGSPLQSTENAASRPPSTPKNQQTPPTPNLTPDRTPPGSAGRSTNRPRPVLSDRIPSKVTTDSRTESFRTAPEVPYVSDDEDGKSTLRPILSSTKTSLSTVRLVSGEGKAKPQTVGLGLGLESSPEQDQTPKTGKEFNAFDGDWGAGGGGSDDEVEVEWDNNLGRNVTVKKRRPTVQANGYKGEVVEDQTVTPTNATKALRSMSLQESPMVYPSPRVPSHKLQVQATSSPSDSTISTDFKRSSILSTKSTASTVVEAILVETAPQRRKTLRHVRKQTTLRDSVSDLSPASSAPTSASFAVDDKHRGRPVDQRIYPVPRESYASTSTSNSVSSRKARREVWKNGGIPVVVVPDRRSSVKSNSREPSLRSTSSRRSQRSQSMSSAPPSQVSKSKEHVPIFAKPRRSRTLSESDGSRAGDQRTIDFPPVVPARSSSLSAPTSRNGSRSGSLTAESLQAHSLLQAQQAHQALQKAAQELDKAESEKKLRSGHENVAHGRKKVDKDVPDVAPVLQAEDRQPEIIVHQQPEISIRQISSTESNKLNKVHQGHLQAGYEFHEHHDYHEHQDEHHHGHHDHHGHRLHTDRFGDPFFGKRLSVPNTPFSIASVETSGTSHAEVSEAQAVNIYPHQNKSVVMVDHSTKPSESSSLDRYKSSDSDAPTIQPTKKDAAVPMTPPQTFTMDDIDSPLRNPRAPPAPPAPPAPSGPPAPPAIQFIPATPSGLTPAVEKQQMLGNYFEMANEKPARSMSLLKRTLTRRRVSEYGPSPVRAPGLLTRTFSLTRRRHDGDARPPLRRYSSADDRPTDENRLHPFWRPMYYDDSESENDDRDFEASSNDRTYKYPPIDNRPHLPRRSLSDRIKRTFAILPVADNYEHDAHYPATTGGDLTNRRTIRRTPSGNLRVMKFRRSLESLPRVLLNDGRPYTAPEDRHHGGRHMQFWRSFGGKPKTSGEPVVKKSGSGGGFLPNLGSKMNIPRRVSERRRAKRSDDLRRMISGPREVRDGVGAVIKRKNFGETFALQQQEHHRQQQLRV